MLDEFPPDVRRSHNLRVEVDVGTPELRVPGFARGQAGAAPVWSVLRRGQPLSELFTKCAPADAVTAGRDARKFMERRGIDLDSEPQAKTETALEFFSAELTGASP